MTVEADLAGLVANAVKADSCPFVLTEATHPHDLDALTALGNAIEATRTRVALVDPGFGTAGAERPHGSPNGPASVFGLYDELEHDRIAWWFRQLADTLTEWGWSGALLPQRWGDRPEDRPHAEPRLVVTMALSGWGHRANRVVVPPWTVDPSLVPDLVDLANLPLPDRLAAAGVAAVGGTRGPRPHHRGRRRQQPTRPSASTHPSPG